MRPSTFLVAASLAAPAFAQTALLREGDASPDGVMGRTISALNNTAVNQSGGYAATMTTTDAGGSVSQVWGNLSGGAGTTLRTEATFGTLEQVSFETFFGISASSVAYSPSVTDSATGTTGLDGVWLDDTIVGIEEMMVAGTTDFITFGSRPGVTQGGIPYFVGGVTDTQGGSTQRRVLFLGAVPGIVYQTGDVIPGLPAALTNSGIDFDFRFSAMGNHHIIPVDIDTSSTDDGAIVVDGAGLVLGGTLVQESLAIPAAVGGIGDSWDNFDFVGITEAGDMMFTGDTDGDIATDEFIVRNGMIWAREGDTLGGEVLTGGIESAFLNENGELAFIWDIEDGAGGDVEALYLEDQLLLKEGDAVDWDGDGMIDAGVTVTNFTGLSALTLSADGSVYFTADVDDNGSILEGYFVIAPEGVGTNYCMANANSTGSPASISGSGSASFMANDLVLTCSSMPSNSFAFFLASQTQDFITMPNGSQGNLCLGGAIGRGVGGGVFNSGAAGELSVSVDWLSVPQPTGPVVAMVGDTWNFQCWMRDSDGMGGATSNFSDGLAVIVE